MTHAPRRPWHGEPTSDVLVLGVVPDTDPRLIRTAVDLARRMHAGLVCVWVDPARVFVEQTAEGMLVTSALDPDAADFSEEPTAEEKMNGHLADLLGEQTPWRFVYRVGATARELHNVAEEVAAIAIVIGARRAGLGRRIAETVAGSVAVRLAHHQRRPLILLPTPTSKSGELP